MSPNLLVDTRRNPVGYILSLGGGQVENNGITGAMNLDVGANKIFHTERHVVLTAPEVHWNTGNIGRTCLGVNAALHLIRPLGFSLDSKQVKRAGLDYWKKVRLMVWDDFNTFLKAMNPRNEETVILTKSGSRSFWDMPRMDRLSGIWIRNQGPSSRYIGHVPGFLVLYSNQRPDSMSESVDIRGNRIIREPAAGPDALGGIPAKDI